MEFFYSSVLGGIHSSSAVIALVFGALIFLSEKGTRKHKKFGYTYFLSMLTLNFSAIPLQNLFGGFGWFHIFIIMSLPYVLLGLYFPLFGRNHDRWQIWHFELMAYSYVGLIAAFIAELFVRVPLYAGVQNMGFFVAGIFITSGIIGGIGYRLIKRYKLVRFS